MRLRKGLDDGLVLFVSADDRRMRIEVGYGLEDRVPDAVASRVIREILTPGFRAGQKDEPVSRAVDALLSSIEGKPLSATPTAHAPRPAPFKPSTGHFIALGFVALAFLILFLMNPSLAFNLLFVIMSGRGRNRGRGGGGGGFSGGGGRSGGGGASGSW